MINGVAVVSAPAEIDIANAKQFMTGTQYCNDGSRQTR